MDTLRANLVAISHPDQHGLFLTDNSAFQVSPICLTNLTSN